ncbi:MULTISPECIES: PaaI family thioesterase [unclassified Paracoccus (in: a-proteobacteria)]|uniref:PaaI family thioesterase n=1 Tax=unclassified Paracoccus (in: a-proteobacteria) TaxID=2688777 RepID=UPI0012B35C60|nr:MULTISPECIES: PaaI family thioesterase [unclassified Paracoccus (in: a-proteobacteria)]UXU75396.1 PaaI family thioesterase [Paracoccus sp. SMMA_5]UXU81301.1 PaaI family thioesterase [Paracoccus sp. SMMA_5_TC]
MDELDRRIRTSFDRQTMMQTLGACLDAIAPGRVSIRAPILPLARQQHGAGHAGLAFSIGDSAAGYAALTLLPPEAEVMTVEMKINLMAPAVGDSLLAEGRVIRAGRRITVVAADVWALTAQGRKHIALLQGTMIPV